MEDRSFESYTSVYGEPIFRFLTGASFDNRKYGDIPYESCIFKIDHVTEIMVVSRYGDKNEWHANCGERAVIYELLKRAAILVEGPQNERPTTVCQNAADTKVGDE